MEVRGIVNNYNASKYETKNYNSNCSCGSGYSSYNNIFVIKDLQQEKSLRKEIDEIQKEW